jgi:hypothetical protein
MLRGLAVIAVMASALNTTPADAIPKPGVQALFALSQPSDRPLSDQLAHGQRRVEPYWYPRGSSGPRLLGSTVGL